MEIDPILLAMATSREFEVTWQAQSASRYRENFIQRLPVETLLSIFQLLEKEDLKAVRLTCGEWKFLPSKFLFDCVFVSPHTKDLEVFTNVSHHPVFSRTVKKLTYLLNGFDPILTTKDYVNGLITQMLLRVQRTIGIEDPRFVDQELDKLWQDAMSLRRRSTQQQTDEIDLTSNRIVQEGLAAYREHAAEEEWNLSTGEMAMRLCVGMARLPNLCAIDFMEHIPSGDPAYKNFDVTTPLSHYQTGSPWIRSWNPLYLSPEFKTPAIRTEFLTMVRALALSGTKLKSLHTWRLCFDLFKATNRMDLTHCINALESLEVLHLWFEARGCDEPEMLENLPRILSSTTQLRELKIILEEFDPYCSSFFFLHTIQEVFGAQFPVWKSLTKLELSGLRCPAQGLVDFCGSHTGLKSLQLGTIELMKGNWADIMDFLSKILQLSEVVLRGPLREVNGTKLWERFIEQRGKTEEYVKHGGANPLRAR